MGGTAWEAKGIGDKKMNGGEGRYRMDYCVGMWCPVAVLMIK